MPLAETAWRNGDADTDREAPFGGRDHLAWVAWHRAFLLCSTRITQAFRGVEPLGARGAASGRQGNSGEGTASIRLEPLRLIRLIPGPRLVPPVNGNNGWIPDLR
jgi:hypothetical protein